MGEGADLRDLIQLAMLPPRRGVRYQQCVRIHIMLQQAAVLLFDNVVRERTFIFFREPLFVEAMPFILVITVASFRNFSCTSIP